MYLFNGPYLLEWFKLGTGHLDKINNKQQYKVKTLKENQGTDSFQGVN